MFQGLNPRCECNSPYCKSSVDISWDERRELQEKHGDYPNLYIQLPSCSVGKGEILEKTDTYMVVRG